ncbi:replication initiator protein A [Hirschia baltica]|uniref:Plasmid replication initiator protein-like protein n=1 Tax=Hirschia baltica (strain ATCC 49814 / DSM 5838 / IFAM 1418) TaxID=582402 RepID=C6XRZ9_HIRBI|nr:replication initiator protein A [Hirschia baltica]ACT60840.1 plasmid replication initiator protein-like protein [Hirschia baltica ATCC 49814]
MVKSTATHKTVEEEGLNDEADSGSVSGEVLSPQDPGPLFDEMLDPNPKHSPLLPERYPMGDLFVCELVDIVLKSDMASLEYPFYSLTKKPDRNPRRFEHDGRWIEFRPSIKGLPTIYDKDLLIYAISHIMREKQRSGKTPKTIVIDPYHFLSYTNRPTGGRDYEALVDSIERLEGTRYRTNVKTGGFEHDEWFGLFERVKMKTRRTPKGGLRPERLEVTISDWTMEAIRADEVLTLHRDYWRLRRPIERRVYEIIRKHCGQQDGWSIGVDKLHRKSGSQATRREFRRKLHEVVNDNHLPDYDVYIENDILHATSRQDFLDSHSASNKIATGRAKKNDLQSSSEEGSGQELGRQIASQLRRMQISADGYDAAKKEAPGWDIYFIEDEWRTWIGKRAQSALIGADPESAIDLVPRKPDAAFIGFCKNWFKTRGKPE